jgi:hypothetical protein
LIRDGIRFGGKAIPLYSMFICFHLPARNRPAMRRPWQTIEITMADQTPAAPNPRGRARQ